MPLIFNKSRNGFFRHLIPVEHFDFFSSLQFLISSPVRKSRSQTLKFYVKVLG